MLSRSVTTPNRPGPIPYRRSGLDPFQRSDAQAVEGLGVRGGIETGCGEGFAEPGLGTPPLFPEPGPDHRRSMRGFGEPGGEGVVTLGDGGAAVDLPRHRSRPELPAHPRRECLVLSTVLEPRREMALGEIGCSGGRFDRALGLLDRRGNVVGCCATSTGAQHQGAQQRSDDPTSMTHERCLPRPSTRALQGSVGRTCAFLEANLERQAGDQAERKPAISSSARRRNLRRCGRDRSRTPASIVSTSIVRLSGEASTSTACFTAVPRSQPSR